MSDQPSSEIQGNIQGVHKRSPSHRLLPLSDARHIRTSANGIVFTSKERDTIGTLDITNASEEVIIFKVKTTSPLKFRVSPPAGLLQPGRKERINVTIVHNVKEGLDRDKFLIMAKVLDDNDQDTMTIDRIHKEFKQADASDIEQYRIRCHYPDPEEEVAKRVTSVESELGATAVARSGGGDVRTDLVDLIASFLILMFDISDCWPKKHHREITAAGQPHSDPTICSTGPVLPPDCFDRNLCAEI